jgi:hypothetical protein
MAGARDIHFYWQFGGDGHHRFRFPRGKYILPDSPAGGAFGPRAENRVGWRDRGHHFCARRRLAFANESNQDRTAFAGRIACND